MSDTQIKSQATGVLCPSPAALTAKGLGGCDTTTESGTPQGKCDSSPIAAAKDWSSISVVVPVYNSAGSLALLLKRLEVVLSAIADDYEVILVNDGSRDGSWEVIEQLSESRRVHGINLMRNYGQHNALLCGIRAAKFDIIVTIDDDLQHPPEEIPKLIGELKEGFDVVYGYPEHQPHGLLRGLASEMTKVALQSSMGAATARRVSAFRAFRTQTRNAFSQYQSPFVSIDVVLTWATTRFTAIQVRHEARTIGQSNYSFMKLLRHAMNMVTGFSTVPLQLANLMGLLFTGLGFLILVFVVARFFVFGTTVPGFTFLASMIALFSGAQLLVLGVMGEYLARVHFRTMERPTYVIERSAARKESAHL